MSKKNIFLLMTLSIVITIWFYTIFAANTFEYPVTGGINDHVKTNGDVILFIQFEGKQAKSGIADFYDGEKLLFSVKAEGKVDLEYKIKTINEIGFDNIKFYSEKQPNKVYELNLVKYFPNKSAWNAPMLIYRLESGNGIDGYKVSYLNSLVTIALVDANNNILVSQTGSEKNLELPDQQSYEKVEKLITYYEGYKNETEEVFMSENINQSETQTISKPKEKLGIIIKSDSTSKSQKMFEPIFSRGFNESESFESESFESAVMKKLNKIDLALSVLFGFLFVLIFTR